jgi:signal transduction histidine kinase
MIPLSLSSRFAVAVLASGISAGAGAILQSLVGYRFPLIAFYPSIMLSAWVGGFWPGMVTTGVSAVLVDRLWLAPLRASGHSTVGDPIALVLFVGIGFAASAFSESLHRSTERERAARERAEASERALQESERQLRIALAEAEQANRLKDHFVAMVSHEIRTPLNAVLGWADMLRSRMSDDRLRTRAVESILANAKRQTQIVDDLLDHERMIVGKLEIRRESVDVTEIARSALEIVQPAADAKAIQILYNAEPGIPAVDADGLRLQQVFWNLLSNAIRFTPEHGVIHFRIGVRDGAVIEVSVSDTGEGVPVELLTRIFDPFQQGDSSASRVHSGLGLGLSIVKYLVEAHGGTVMADSAGIGRGSTFKVRLPIVRDVVAASRPASAMTARSAAYTGVASKEDDAPTAHVEARSSALVHQAPQSTVSAS